MPLEIKEIEIRMRVDDGSGDEPDAGDGAPDADGGEGDREAIVAECVQRVLRILRAKQER